MYAFEKESSKKSKIKETLQNLPFIFQNKKLVVTAK